MSDRELRPEAVGPPAIREMEARDADEVAVLTSELGYRRSAADIRDWIADLEKAPGRQAAFVACLGDEVAGWIEVSMERRLQSPDFALVGGLVVAHGRRSHGIGRLLVQRAEQWAWRHGAARLRVTSRSTRTDAHRFYLREGFQTVKTSMVFEKPREG